MAKAKEEKKVTSVKVRYRDAATVKAGLEGLAQEVPLPLPVAMRVARMIATLGEAGEAVEKERRKVAKQVKDKTMTNEDADEAFRKELDKSFDLRGHVPYSVIKEDADRRNGEPPRPNMGNIIAAILPVLAGAPEDDSHE
jgi:hypothetical protein